MTETADGKVVLNGLSQQLADRAIDGLGDAASLSIGAAFSRLTEHLDQFGRLVEHTLDARNWLFAPEPDELVRLAVEELEQGADQDVVRRQLVDLAQIAFEGGEQYWGEEPTGPIIASIQHTGGRWAYLLYSIDTYGEGPYTWHGLFADRQALEQHVRSWGRLIRPNEFESVLGALIEAVMGSLE